MAKSEIVVLAVVYSIETQRGLEIIYQISFVVRGGAVYVHDQRNHTTH